MFKIFNDPNTVTKIAVVEGEEGTARNLSSQLLAYNRLCPYTLPANKIFAIIDISYPCGYDINNENDIPIRQLKGAKLSFGEDRNEYDTQGVIAAVSCNTKTRYISCFAFIDKNRFPKLVRGIKDGYLEDLYISLKYNGGYIMNLNIK